MKKIEKLVGVCNCQCHCGLRECFTEHDKTCHHNSQSESEGMNNEQKFELYQQLKKEILEIATPSTNPDNFTDLVDTLEKIEKDLRVSLLHEKKLLSQQP